MCVFKESSPSLTRVPSTQSHHARIKRPNVQRCRRPTQAPPNTIHLALPQNRHAHGRNQPDVHMSDYTKQCHNHTWRAAAVPTACQNCPIKLLILNKYAHDVVEQRPLKLVNYSQQKAPPTIFQCNIDVTKVFLNNSQSGRLTWHQHHLR